MVIVGYEAVVCRADSNKYRLGRLALGTRVPGILFSMLSDAESDEVSEIHQLTINEHYAKAFQYKKEREELTKLKEKGDHCAVICHSNRDSVIMITRPCCFELLFDDDHWYAWVPFPVVHPQLDGALLEI